MDSRIGPPGGLVYSDIIAVRIVRQSYCVYPSDKSISNGQRFIIEDLISIW